MRKILAIIAIALFMGAFYFTSTAWIPIGSGVEPKVRDLLTEQRYMPIDPGKYGVFMDDFWEFPQASKWDTTSVVVETGSIGAISDSLSIWGMFKINYGTNAKGPYDGYNITTTQAPFRLQFSPAKPDSITVPLEFECKVMFNNVIESTFIAGLVAAQATPSASLLMNQANGIYFLKYDRKAGITATNALKIYAKAIYATQAAADSVLVLTTSARQTWYRLKIVWNGATAKFYINDVYCNVLSTTAHFPTAHLHGAFEVCAGDSVANFSYLDYMWVKPKR